MRFVRKEQNFQRKRLARLRLRATWLELFDPFKELKSRLKASERVWDPETEAATLTVSKLRKQASNLTAQDPRQSYDPWRQSRRMARKTSHVQI